MDRKKIKQIVIDNAPEFIEGAVLTIAAIGAYTITCRLAGYRMVKPVSVEADWVYFKSISGKDLRAPIIHQP